MGDGLGNFQGKTKRFWGGIVPVFYRCHTWDGIEGGVTSDRMKNLGVT